jgi:hypothetical protein
LPGRFAMLFITRMTDNSITASLERINLALNRIEAVAARPKPSAMPDGDSRYQALRTRTQAALASLETVIAQIGSNGRPN